MVSSYIEGMRKGAVRKPCAADPPSSTASLSTISVASPSPEPDQLAAVSLAEASALHHVRLIRYGRTFAQARRSGDDQLSDSCLAGRAPCPTDLATQDLGP